MDSGILQITGTGNVDFVLPDSDTVGSIVFVVKGITSASGSFKPQIRGAEGTTYYDKQYINWATEATVTAGTAITADGIYKVLCDRGIVSADVTAAGSALWTITLYPMQG